MIYSYFIVALRNLTRRKLFTWINVGGLGLGLGCCIMMALFIKHEWTFDRFHEDHDRIFRIVRQRILPNGNAMEFETEDTMHPPWLVDGLRDGLTGVVQACAFTLSPLGLFAPDDKTIPQRIGFVNDSFLQMFNFPFVAGNPSTALSGPDGIIITETTAREIFGDTKWNSGNLIGQELKILRRNFVVTAVMADVPERSSIQFDALVHIDGNKGFPIARGGNDNELAHWALASIYVQTAEGQEPLVTEAINRWSGKDRLQQEREGSVRLILQPLRDVYWNAEIPNHNESNAANPEMVFVLWTLSLVILSVASINYTLMCISESSGRATEVGMRKVLGAKPTQIMKQFWCETLLLSFLGMLIGIAIAEVFLPVFNGFVQRDLSIAIVDDGLILLGLFFVIGLLAGSYPAVLLSRLQPVAAMKKAALRSRNRLTGLLIVLQYSSSIALMICTGVMIQQQGFIRDRDLGFNRERIVIIKSDRRTAKRLKQEITKDPRILGTTITDRTLTKTGGSSYTEIGLPDGSIVKTNIIGVDADYLRIMQIPLLEGRNFSIDRPLDYKKAVLINKTLAEELKLGDPIGKTISGNTRLNDPTIIGVVRDFHFNSLHETIKPLVLRMEKYNTAPSLLVRVRQGEIPRTLRAIETIWEDVVPDVPFRFSFLDDRLKRQYRDDERWYRILFYSTFFTLAISCFGLLGLTSVAVAQRRKEIGIRRVLGASAGSIVWLLSREFVSLSLASNVIAWPVAYWTMSNWLANFAYHVELGLGVFVLIAGLTIAITQLTTFTLTYKLASRNPVETLRYE